MPLSEHNSGAGEGDRRSAGSPESSLVGSLPALFADLRRLDSQNERCISPGLSPAVAPWRPFWRFAHATTMTLHEEHSLIAAALPANEWLKLRVEFKGSRFRILYNGQQLFEVEDATFSDAGKIRLWTKADSVTLFDATLSNFRNHQEANCRIDRQRATWPDFAYERIPRDRAGKSPFAPRLPNGEEPGSAHVRRRSRSGSLRKPSRV